MFPAAHFKSRSYLKRAGNCRTFNPSKETINMVKCKVSEKRDLRVIVSEKKAMRPRSYRLLSLLHSNEFKRSSAQLSGRAALEAAKEKKTAKQVSLQSEIKIGEG